MPVPWSHQRSRRCSSLLRRTTVSRSGKTFLEFRIEVNLNKKYVVFEVLASFFTTKDEKQSIATFAITP